jgi:ferredoxin-NAD(P)+ reductase (naphthalene dioxygenase ferredoxin-specific)
MELTIEPHGTVVAVGHGANLLATLRENNVPVSYSCTAGRCGTCRCKVVKGVVLDTGREVKLTNPANGEYVLACTTVLTEDCTIEIPEPDEIVNHPARILKATVIAIDDPTHDIRRLRLRSAKPLEFSPGQYAKLQFTPQHVRPYSMAGLPTDTELEFHVRILPDGRVGQYIARDLQLGDTVRITGPLGTAYLRTRHQGPMLCVAGGTGLAPVLSIVRGALENGMRNDIHLYFGVRSAQDLYGVDRLMEMAEAHANFHPQIVLASGRHSLPFRSGLVTDAFREDWSSLDGWKAYFCGAPPMVDAASLVALERGIAAVDIHADAFYTNPT